MPPENAGELLKIENLHAWYGESHILHGLELTVHEGEVITLLGRNGSGRSTTLKAILGLVGKRTGSIRVNGTELINLPTHQIARVGKLGYCPEERGIYASLNVDENLVLPPVIAEGGLSVDEIYQMFPNLKERRKSQGSKLSGGEQQMLAIGRALMSKPRLMILDEPSLGLAPLVIKQIFEIIARLRDEGITVFLVEQNANQALQLADRGYVLETGRIRLQDTGDNLLANPDVQAAYLGG